MKAKNLYRSPGRYTIQWIEFRAVKGIVTAHDKKQLLDVPQHPGARQTRVFRWFRTRELCLKFIERVKSMRLDKHYEVRMFTDRQFALARTGSNGAVIPFTKKQEAEMLVV